MAVLKGYGGMSGLWARCGLVVLAVVATLAAEPRVRLALERPDDPAPQRLVLAAEMVGRQVSLVISWSQPPRLSDRARQPRAV